MAKNQNKPSKRERATVVTFKGIRFYTGITKKFNSDFFKVKEILEKETLDKADRINLLVIYNVAYHTENKIEGASSYDSSCRGCAFCGAMKDAGKADPTIICNYCYDEAQERRWVDVENRHKLNMLIMSEVEFGEDELMILPATLINRINSSGDCPNATYARNVVKIAKVNPVAKFALWAKNHPAVQQAVKELGKPVNLILIKSSIMIGIPDALPEYFDYVFTVYPTEASCAEAIRNGAAPCNGKKCKDCGWKCYYGTHPKGANIAEVLRCGEKTRALIVKAFEEKGVM